MTHSKPERTITDQEYLKNEQYRTDANLRARIALHRKYGTNPGSWFRWVFDRLPVAPDAVILEIGCGPGDLWYENRDRTGQALTVLLGDLSTGMVKAAREKNASQPCCRYLALDAQHIPLPSGSLDCIIANHMLYHVPDMEAALSEMRRVLKPGGRLCAATNGLLHMHQIHELIQQFIPTYSIPLLAARRFTLEDGPELLQRYFTSVNTEIFVDNLMVTGAADLMNYIASMWHTENQVDRQTFDRLHTHISAMIRDQGHIFIEKSQGIIMAAV